MLNDRQNKSRPARQNNDPDQLKRCLSDSDIKELIQFLQVLNRWIFEIKNSLCTSLFVFIPNRGKVPDERIAVSGE